jgi:nitrilase
LRPRRRAPGEALLTADLDLSELARGTFDLDVVGHYARPDIFRLVVNETAQVPVSCVSDVGTDHELFALV